MRLRGLLRFTSRVSRVIAIASLAHDLTFETIVTRVTLVAFGPLMRRDVWWQQVRAYLTARVWCYLRDQRSRGHDYDVRR
jgi:hypothetical protein